MIILIVDDEKLTREGIISSINWNNLGIQKVLQADDGLNGLKQARKYKPDIVLSDVRMPRMDGIEMIREIQKTLPNASIIFMSGYSDKEYLKAAIKFKAISYIEKPIDSMEIEVSIKNAIEHQLLTIRNRITVDSHNKYIQNKLALQIIYSNATKNTSEILSQFESLGYNVKKTTKFTVLIITLKTVISSIEDEKINEFYQAIDRITDNHHTNYIVAVKNDEYIVLHLFSDEKTSEYTVSNICHSLSVYLSQSYKFFIAIGKRVRGINNVYQSYNAAVLLLQSSYFYEYNSIIVSNESKEVPIPLDKSLIDRYIYALQNNSRDEVISVINLLFNYYKNNQHILPNAAKEVYYQLFSELSQKAVQNHVPNLFNEVNKTILDYISSSTTLYDLNEFLIHSVTLFFSSLVEASVDHSTIYAIKDFIGKNYGNDSLSVKDIGKHVFLSSSYVCTLFKNETNQTLNQYLTEFRIDKAKKMLLDAKYKITDISAKVGYSDGNYFGKTFKKIVGISPSEYREKYTKI